MVDISQAHRTPQGVTVVTRSQKSAGFTVSNDGFVMPQDLIRILEQKLDHALTFPTTGFLLFQHSITSNERHFLIIVTHEPQPTFERGIFVGHIMAEVNKFLLNSAAVQ